MQMLDPQAHASVSRPPAHNDPPVTDAGIYSPSRKLPNKRLFKVEVLDRQTGAVFQTLDNLKTLGPFQIRGWIPIQDTIYANSIDRAKRVRRWIHIKAENIVEWGHEFNPRNVKRPVFWVLSDNVCWYQIQTYNKEYEPYYASLASVCIYLDAMIHAVFKLGIKDDLSTLVPKVASILDQSVENVWQQLNVHRDKMIELGASDNDVANCTFYQEWTVAKANEAAVAAPLGLNSNVQTDGLTGSDSPDPSSPPQHVEIAGLGGDSDDVAMIDDDNDNGEGNVFAQEGEEYEGNSELAEHQGQEGHQGRVEHRKHRDSFQSNHNVAIWSRKDYTIGQVEYETHVHNTAEEIYEGLHAPCTESICPLHLRATTPISEELSAIITASFPESDEVWSEPNAFHCPIPECLVTICSSVCSFTTEFVGEIKQHVAQHDLSSKNDETLLKNYFAQIKSRKSTAVNTVQNCLDIQLYWMIKSGGFRPGPKDSFNSTKQITSRNVSRARSKQNSHIAQRAARFNGIVTLELPRKEAEVSIPHALDTHVALEGSEGFQEPEEEEEIMEQGQVTVRRSEAESGESPPESGYHGLGKASIDVPQKRESERNREPRAGDSENSEEEIQAHKLCLKRPRVQVIGSESDQSLDEKKTDKGFKAGILHKVKKDLGWKASLFPKRQRSQRNGSSDEIELSSKSRNRGPGVRRATRKLSRHKTGQGEQSSDTSSESDTAASDPNKTSGASGPEGYVESVGDSESGSATSSESDSESYARRSKRSRRIPDDISVVPPDGRISFMRCRYCCKLLDESIGHDCKMQSV